MKLTWEMLECADTINIERLARFMNVYVKNCKSPDDYRAKLIISILNNQHGTKPKRKKPKY